jgi:hypothetical protein
MNDLTPQPSTSAHPSAQRSMPRLATAAIPDYRILRMADRACCCSARPVVIAIMPPVPGRDHATDLLLCGHHYRASRQALDGAGAHVYDGAGRSEAGGVPGQRAP